MGPGRSRGQRGSELGRKKSRGGHGGKCPPRHVMTATPHSGYHFDGSDRRFFEGWYFKVSWLDYGADVMLIQEQICHQISTCLVH